MSLLKRFIVPRRTTDALLGLGYIVRLYKFLLYFEENMIIKLGKILFSFSFNKPITLLNNGLIVVRFYTLTYKPSDI